MIGTIMKQKTLMEIMQKSPKKRKKRRKRNQSVRLISHFYVQNLIYLSCTENNITENHDQTNEITENVVDNEVDNEEAGEGEKKKKKRNRKKGGAKSQELTAPQISIVDQFPDGVYPIGEIQQYLPSKDDRTAKDRFTNEEKRALDRMHNDIYNEVRLAAEAHRQVN